MIRKLVFILVLALCAPAFAETGGTAFCSGGPLWETAGVFGSTGEVLNSTLTWRAAEITAGAKDLMVSWHIELITPFAQHAFFAVGNPWTTEYTATNTLDNHSTGGSLTATATTGTMAGFYTEDAATFQTYKGTPWMPPVWVPAGKALKIWYVVQAQTINYSFMWSELP